MKYRIPIIILAVIAIVFFTFMLYKNNFSKSIYVITKDVEKKRIDYYEINDRKAKRKTDNFTSNSELYTTSSKCFEEFVNNSKNFVLDELQIDNCNVRNENGDPVYINNKIKRIIELVADKGLKIDSTEIIKAVDDYYVMVTHKRSKKKLYDFYKYDDKNDNLKFLYRFKNEKVIGVRYKE